MKTTLEDFGGRDALWPAERKLLDEVHTGLIVHVSPGVPPEDPSDNVKIRASFLRYLARGGCEACRPSPKGVRVRGAYIAGDETDPRADTKGLDLEGATLPGDLSLFKCRLPDMALLRGTTLPNLILDESELMGGLSADRLTVHGNVSLVGATVTGKVSLLGANLGAVLDCRDARLTAELTGNSLNADRLYALVADRLDAKGSVFLSDATVIGEVSLLGAKLGGGLACDSATLNAGKLGTALSADRMNASGDVSLCKAGVRGEIRLTGARLGGDFVCKGAKLEACGPRNAISADNLKAGGTFFLSDGASVKGVLELTAAEVGVISDDPKCWPGKGDLALNRFRYGAIMKEPVDAKSRLDWLALQDPRKFGQKFWPQPYEQLAKVFREMGHADDARTVLIEKERLQRADRRGRASRPLRTVLSFRDFILAVTVRYGRVPLLAVAWLGLFLVVGTWVFWKAAASDAIKPNNAVILRGAEWGACDPAYLAPPGGPAIRWRSSDPSQLACFLAQDEAASYPAFNAFIYSADALLPIINFGMQAHWAPDERAPFGRGARWYLWVHIALGWALSLLAVAGFSGLIKSD